VVNFNRSDVLLSSICLLKFVQSHVVGRGPHFVRVAFNIFGRSPLISQYLASMNADVCKGVTFLIERTELDNLPPYPFVFIILLCVFTHLGVRIIAISVSLCLFVCLSAHVP